MKHLLFSNRLYAIFFLISFSLLFPYGTCAQTLSTQDKIVSDTIKIPKEVGGIQKGSYFVIQKSANKPSNIDKIFIYVPFGGDRHKEIPLTKGIKLRETIYKNGDRDTIYTTIERSAVFRNADNKILMITGIYSFYPSFYKYLMSNFKDIIPLEKEIVESKYLSKYEEQIEDQKYNPLYHIYD